MWQRSIAGCYQNNVAWLYNLTQEAIAIDAGVLWLQLGIVNEQAAVLAKNVGMKVVMDRCPKIEIPRLGLDR